MAVTPEGARLTELQRRLQQRISDRALRRISGVWRLVDVTDLRGTWSAFVAAAVPVLIEAHADSAAAAQRYYRAFRSVETGVQADEPTPAPVLPREVAMTSISGAGVSGIVNARRQGLPISAAVERGRTKVDGTATRLVLSGGRETVDSAIRGESRALGWMRVTGADPCDWCAMLASRGPAYKERATAAFDFPPDAAHDHDHCVVEPVYDRRTELPETSRRWREIWRESTRGRSGEDARRAFRHAMAERTTQ